MADSLKPFYQATVELSEERRVSESKEIPISNMLRHVISTEWAQMAPCIGATLTNHLRHNMNEEFNGLEKMNSLSVAPSWIHGSKRLALAIQAMLRLLLKG